ncbi:hypothetical protein SLEP1_g11960 [Rubroshorea leprosula]|nr:hypothetical protein SLEP1_g11960 [Rubroshorea leprosula]
MEILHFLFIVLSSFVALFSCIYLYTKRPGTCRKGSCSALQAGGALPIIGHMHLFGGHLLTHKTLAAMAEKYGPIFTIRLGSRTSLVLNSWEVVKECFTIHDKAFSGRPSLTVIKLLGYDFAMFGFAPYGPYWREIRKIAVIELLSNHRIDLLKYIRTSEIEIATRVLYKAWLSNGSAESGGEDTLDQMLIVGKEKQGDARK